MFAGQFVKYGNRYGKVTEVASGMVRVATTSSGFNDALWFDAGQLETNLSPLERSLASGANYQNNPKTRTHLTAIN